MAILSIHTFRDGRWSVRGEGPFPGTVDQIKASAPSYALQYAHRFYLDGVLVHEESAPTKSRKARR